MVTTVCQEPQLEALPSPEAATSPTDLYRYSPLVKEKKQTRVLLLQPGHGADPITGTLHTIDFTSDDAPPFETISYAWGEQAIRADILLDGRVFSVPASSAAALRRLRLPERSRRLWIDAVCICQEDVEERNHQVGIMREIYERGGWNLIYLGEARAEVARAAKESVFAIMQEIREVTGGVLESLNSVFFNDNGNRKYDDKGLRGGVDVKALCAFFSCPWFSRLWVMQEATVSHGSTCFFGDETIDLLEVVRAAHWIHYKQNSVLQRLANSPGVLNGTALWDFVDPSGVCHKLRGTSVAHALRFAKNLDATEPRDSVYGALGLMGSFTRSEEIPFELAPDYRRTLVDVCRDATRAALYEDEGKHTRFLLQIISHHSESDFEEFDWPSWVPRWPRARNHAQEPGLLGAYFTADDNIPLSARSLAQVGDPRRLTLSGITLDSILERSSVLTKSCVYNLPDFQRWIAAAMTLAKEGSSTRADAEIADVLIAGQNAEGGAPSEIDLASLQDAVDTASTSSDELRAGQSESQQYQQVRFGIALEYACTNRRLFTTASGRLGLGPKVLKSGDEIVVLYGSRTPLVLRRYGAGNSFRIVGECYLHGAMYGDDVRRLRGMGRPDEVFSIF